MLTALPPPAGTTKTSELVTQAVVRPPTRATNATLPPSGDTLTSSMPPNGWVGESVSCPGVMSRASVCLAAERRRRPHEQVGVLAVLPAVPVAEQELIVDARLHLAGLDLGVALGRVLDAPGRRPHVDGQHQALAVRERLEAVHVDRQAGHLLGPATARRDAPDLRCLRAGGEEQHRAAVGCPRRVGVVLRVPGQPPDRAAVDSRDPDVEAAAVGLDVGVADRERHQLAVGRDDRTVNPLHGEHVVDGQAAPGGAGRARADHGRDEERRDGGERETRSVRTEHLGPPGAAS